MHSRRFFLKSSGLALVSIGMAPPVFVRSAWAARGAARKKTLVVAFQRGACDGLNTVIPYAEEAYRRLRPTIAIPAPRGGSREAALELDGRFGLHPALEPLLPLWKEGSLGVVHAIGSPDSTRSHFDAQDYMESGTPGRKSTDDGWMNRSLQSRPDAQATPFRAVSLTPTLPRVLSGRAPAVAMGSLQQFGLRGGPESAAARTFEDMYGRGGTDRGSGAETQSVVSPRGPSAGIHSRREPPDIVHGAGQDAFAAIDFLRKADPARYQPASGVQYRGRYGDALKQVAQLIKADVGVELAFTEIGGWDHHAAEGGVQGQLAARLREFGGALAAFHKDLGDRMQDVVLVTLTEFGRTVRENGNRGTDHGHAGVSFVMGGGIRGGTVHGRWPGLGSGQLHEGRDLALTTDFRDLLAELLTRHLGARDLAPVFPGHAGGASRFPGVMRA